MKQISCRLLIIIARKLRLKSGAYPKTFVLIGLYPTLSHWGAKNRRQGIPLNADPTSSDHHQRCNEYVVMHFQTI